MDEGYEKLIKAINKKNKGSIIYTGNPDFNENYLAKRRTLKQLLNGNYLVNLATREQELELKANYFESIAEKGIPLIKIYFRDKKIRRTNASKDRKLKPNKQELEVFKQKYIYDEAKEKGWMKAAGRVFSLHPDTISDIYHGKLRISGR